MDNSPTPPPRQPQPQQQQSGAAYSQQQLPNKRSVEQAIKVIEDFRAVCRHQMDLGYWATVDFPSKHHINKLLGLQERYRKREDLVRMYGEGLVRHISEIMPSCKAYVAFLQESKPEIP